MGTKKKVPGFLAEVDSVTGKVFCYLSGEEITGRTNGIGDGNYRKLRIRDEQTCELVDLYVHRIAAATKNGIDPREIPEGCQVDHVVPDRHNNSFSNLQILSLDEHKEKTRADREKRKIESKASAEVKSELRKRAHKIKKAA